jgi:NADH:ubiquinone oxidoreductase subunit E
MDDRIGFYVCHCGTNIAGKVRVQEVRDAMAKQPGVEAARDYMFMCSDGGQEMIQKDIRELGLTRVVVASCSPRMHERTFRGVCQRAGLNPYEAFHMVCIREHCSWVTDDPGEATTKAIDLCRAGVHRVPLQHALDTKVVPVNPNVLVVGGGIAGMQAALDVASAGFKAYVVEKQPTIGGHMLQFDKTFPTLDCAACIGTPKMVSVGQSPNIELMAYHEVEDVSGFVGSFKVKVRKKKRYVEVSKCTGCGACAQACVVKNVIQIPERPPLPVMEPEEESVLEATLSSHGNRPGDLIAMLIDISDKLGYLPRPVLTNLAYRLEIPLAHAFRVATFYAQFRFEPLGRHQIAVCQGTACHVLGGKRILKAVSERLGIQPGQTTPDREFSLDRVACFGACALAPVVVIDEKVYGEMSPAKVEKLIDGLVEEREIPEGGIAEEAGEAKPESHAEELK